MSAHKYLQDTNRGEAESEHMWVRMWAAAICHMHNGKIKIYYLGFVFFMRNNTHTCPGVGTETHQENSLMFSLLGPHHSQ